MNDRPADLNATEARLREFLSAEVARARLDYPSLAPRSRPRSTLSFAPLVALSMVVVMALVGAGLLASRSWSARQGGVALPSTSPAAEGTLDVLLIRVEPRPGVFPAMGGHVAFVEIRLAGAGGLLHELRLNEENTTTVQLLPGSYTASTRVDVYGDVLLEGESEPPSYGEVARCPDVEFEVVSGFTTPLTVTVQEPDPTCSAVAGSPEESRPGPAPSQTRAPVPGGTAASTLQSPGLVPVAPNAWGPLAVIDPEPPFHLGAAMATGTIRITEDCVLLDEGAREVLLVWMAYRTTWNAPDRSVTFRNLDGAAVTVGDGDQVELGGAGESAEEGGLREEVWLSPPSPSCPRDERFTVSGVEAVP